MGPAGGGQEVLLLHILLLEGFFLSQFLIQVLRVVVGPLHGVVGDRAVLVQVLGVVFGPVQNVDRDPLIGPFKDDRNLRFADPSSESHLLGPNNVEIVAASPYKALVVHGDV